jgi:hypothetical protein
MEGVCILSVLETDTIGNRVFIPNVIYAYVWCSVRFAVFASEEIYSLKIGYVIW